MTIIYDPDQVSPKTERILRARAAAYAALEGPRIGDYVIHCDRPEDTPDTRHDFQIERIVYDYTRLWGENIQTGINGSFYLGQLDDGTAYVSHSGSCGRCLPKTELINSGHTRSGAFWFFHDDHRMAHNGFGFSLPCRVYLYRPEEDQCPPNTSPDAGTPNVSTPPDATANDGPTTATTATAGEASPITTLTPAIRVPIPAISA